MIMAKNSDTLHLQNQLEESRRQSEAVQHELVTAQQDRDTLETKLKSLMAIYGVEGGNKGV